MITNIPCFGDIDTESLKDYCQISLTVDCVGIQEDLNFKNTAIVPDKLHKIVDFLEGISSLISNTTNYIHADLDNDEVRFFLDFHKEEHFDKDLAFLLESADNSLLKERQILSVTRAKRIGFYPEEDNYFAVLDLMKISPSIYW